VPKELSYIVNVSNGVNVVTPDPPVSFRFFIGRGNNGALVKRILKARGYWTKADSKATANFVWTQWRDKRLLSVLASADAPKIMEDPP
jgi:hypothetical protein